MDYRGSAQSRREHGATLGDIEVELLPRSNFEGNKLRTRKGWKDACAYTRHAEEKEARRIDRGRREVRGTSKNDRNEGERVEACIGNVIATTADFQTMRGE